MKRFFLYFGLSFFLVLLASFIHAEVYALLIIIVLAIIKLLRELVTVDIGRLKYALVVIMTYVAITVLYGCIYYFLAEDHVQPAFAKSFSGVFEAIYFSFATITTLGYGDLKPASSLAKVLVVSQLLVGIFIIAVGINYVIGKRRELQDNADKNTSV